MEIVKLVLDICIIAALALAVRYAWRLEKQLRLLRESREEMARYTADFARNVDRAETGIKSLKLMARASGDDLEQLVEKGQALRDELQFVVDHANSIADKITRLGGQLAQQQTRVAESPMPAAPPVSAPIPMPTVERPSLRAVVGGAASAQPAEPRSRAERELLQALQRMQERGG